jgi:tRNA A-37 threonylcarbamoyl transferase component Bud32
VTIATPPGFVAVNGRDGRWLADAEIADALGRAHLLEAEGVRAALARAEGASGRARTALVSIGAARLVLRGVRRGGLLGPLLGGALLTPDRPLREIAVTAALRSAGAPVPRPAFGAAFRSGPSGLVWNGAVATFFEVGARDAESWLRDAATPATLPCALTSAGEAMRRFHDAGGSHPDLHGKNLLVREVGERCEIVVIDLDRARVEAQVTPRARMGQLMRLYRSLLKRDLLRVVGDAGCATFFDAYVQQDRALRDAMLARLPAERRRVARHALGYRRPKPS